MNRVASVESFVEKVPVAQSVSGLHVLSDETIGIERKNGWDGICPLAYEGCCGAIVPAIFENRYGCSKNYQNCHRFQINKSAPQNPRLIN